MLKCSVSFFQDLSFILTLTLIVDVSQNTCWAAVLMFQRASASSLVNCSALGDEGSGALPRAFIQTRNLPDLNIIYWHPCDNRLPFCLAKTYRFTFNPRSVGTSPYKLWILHHLCEIGRLPNVIRLFCGLLFHRVRATSGLKYVTSTNMNAGKFISRYSRCNWYLTVHVWRQRRLQLQKQFLAEIRRFLSSFNICRSDLLWSLPRNITPS